MPVMNDENVHLTNEKNQLLDELKRQHILVEDMRIQMDELRSRGKEERQKVFLICPKLDHWTCPTYS